MSEMIEKSEMVVGIDLGTTNSAIAVIIDGKPQIIEIEGSKILPSCVGLDESGKLLVGQKAKNQIIAAPDRTITSVKRKMGEHVKIPLGDQSFTPEEISSFILRELANQAQKFLGKPVKRAVITVPAYFNEQQRKATRDAGELAGLEVVRIIHEPTAASIAYNAENSGQEKVLVYDLGGGTFDASLVLIENGVIEVKASHGDTHLGGDDFDQLLVHWAVEEFKNKNQIDLSADFRAKRRLQVVMERVKCQLSNAPFVKIREEYIHENQHLELEVSRSHYESMIRPLIERTLESVQKCLRDSSLLPSDLDKIMLVGGSTLTPLVQELLKERFGQEPRFEIDPELIVALGASIQAGNIAGLSTSSVLVDITPHSFGTSALGMIQGIPVEDKYVPIIKRNSAIPVRKSEVFFTAVDGQEEVLVKIFQGEELLGYQNTPLGEFRVQGLSNVPQGNPIVIFLDLDVNGMLKVTAEEKFTGLSKTVTLDTKTVQHHLQLDDAKRNIAAFMESADVESAELLDESPALAHDYWSEVLQVAKGLRRKAEKFLDNAGEKIDSSDRAQLDELLNESKKAIQDTDAPGLTRQNEALSDLLYYLED